VEPKSQVKYPSIVEKIKVTLLLEGPHFEEDAAMFYIVIANSSLDTTAYSYVMRIKVSRNGRRPCLL
jgi:beta-xylosidase